MNRSPTSRTDEDPGSSQLFLFTAANPRARHRLETSLRRGVELSRLEDLPVFETLRAHARDRRVYAWGSKTGASGERKWSRLRPGDVGLVYSDGRFVLSVRVLTKARSSRAAEAIWGHDDEGSTWECMTFFDPVQAIDVSLSQVTSALGYDTKYVPQGLEIPGPDRQERLRQDFGSVEAFVETLRQGSAGESRPRYWWVNQGTTYAQEHDAGIVWAPKRARNGASLQHWRNVMSARAGDVILHYASGGVRAVSRALGDPAEAAKPAVLPEHEWSDDGYLLRTAYRECSSPVALNEIPLEWRLEQGAPFTKSGGVQQAYFFPLSQAFAERMAHRFPQLGIVEGRPNRKSLTVEAVRATAEDRGLILDDDVYGRVIAALNSGKHVILTGPPGTAKTTLAQAVADAAAAGGHCAGYALTTATADWTTYETIGGLKPTADQALEFAEGHFLEAIAKRRWLVIDEVNRSNFDRAFGQLFTVLSGQPVVLPYRRKGQSAPLTLVPAEASPPTEDADVLRVSADWRVIGTMNVFDKSLLFEMSYALMRRFAFIEIPSPAESVFDELIDAWSDGSTAARDVARELLALREIKDLGPAVYRDIARYAAHRTAQGSVPREKLLYECFYSYLLPQFEGISDDEGERLFSLVGTLVGRTQRRRLRETLRSVLGIELASFEGVNDDSASEEPPDASSLEE